MKVDQFDADRRLDAALKNLPREKASPGFGAKVLTRWKEQEGAVAEQARVLPFAQRSRRPALPLWIAVAAALILAALGAREWQHRRDQEEALRRIAELRARYEALADTLEELRMEAAAARPVVYLGGNEKLDLVLDLEQLADAKGQPQPMDPKTRQAMAEELSKLIREGQGTLY